MLTRVVITTGTVVHKVLFVYSHKASLFLKGGHVTKPDVI